MNMQPITPRQVRLRILGHDVCLTITSASAPDAGAWLDQNTIDVTELGTIQFDLCMHRLCGEFEAVSSRLHTVHGREPLQYAGMWHLVPDYRQLLRIFRWWYNYDLAEALTLEVFEETYGKRMGEHYHDKWTLYDRSVSKMIGYFGTNITAGQKFLDMVMDAVARYERRTNSDHPAICPSASASAENPPQIHV